MTYRSSMPFKVSAKHHDPNSLTFSMYTADEIRDLSVAEIKTPQSFNVLGHPYKFGLYDPRLGPLSEKSDSCGTCGKGMSQCVGHFGRIDLPLPVVNPLFHKQFCTIIKSSCLNCFSLHLKATDKANIIEKLEELSTESVLDSETYEQIVDSILSKITFKKAKHKVKLYTCVNCQEEYLKPEIMRNKIFLKKMSTKINSAVNATTQMMLMANDGKEYLRKIWENDSVILKLLIPCLKSVSIDYPTDIMFLDVVPVIPPIVRPTNYVDGSMLEHPQTQIYKSIMEDCVVIRNISKVIKDGADQVSEMVCSLFKQIPGATATEKLQLSWQSLQANIDHLMDRDANKTSESANCQGLKQIIEKKAGIIRMHMMGKRVNFAARSVITPDPNLNIDEIGIPEAFALKLTYPVPVTPWNVTELRQLIMNGPDIFPGAVMIEDENGSTKRLNPKDTVTREAIAKRLLTPGEKIDQFFDGIKIVHRHLQNGDILLLNRQPTLHRPSLMAHKARILKGEKTIRMHYSNCKSYNADFDGDEMNVHFPQNEIARSEGYNIANVSNHYLVPKDGTPLGGLIQDHVISGVKLTVRGKFFSRDDYMQLVFSGLSDHRGDILLLPPTIIKPIPLWSGKQVVSTVIMNIIPHGRAKINLTAGSKISDKDWQIEAPREWKHGIKFKQPETMSEAQVIIRNGELLSGVLDKTHYGATTYGLIHCAYELYGGACSSRMLSAFGKLFLAHLQITGFTLGIHDILLVPEMESHRRKQMKKYRKIGNDLHKQILELPEDTPRDEVIEKIEESYSKNPKFRGTVDQKYKDVLGKFTGDMNNTCIKTGLLKKFPSNNLQLMVQSGAKGSTVNTMQISGHLGQIELEGKRPPLMISGRSLPSFAPYDSSGRAGGFIDGRFMTGIQPQEFFFHCMAGREGLIDTAVKTSRSGYLQRCCVKHLEGIAVQYDSTVRDFDGSLIQMLYGEDGLDIGGSKFLTNKQIDFLVDNKKAILDSGEVKKSDIRAELLNERLESIVDDYMNKRSSSYDKSIDKEEVKDILKIKSARAMCPPGESVGLLAAQSIGEPSTQMTLNTFHFAGRGEMNVTLGIPRLREILMTASKKIKTPSMEIPFKKNINNFEKKTNDLKIKLTKCMLNDVLKKITIQRKLNKYPRELEYTMRLEFLPYKNYKHKFCLSSHKVLLATEDEFFYKFFVELKNSAKKKEDKKLVNVQSDKENLKGKDDEDENDEDVDDPDKTVKSKKIKNGFGEMHESSDEEEVDEDDDATATKSRSKRQENQEYDDDDDDEEKEKEEDDDDDDDEDNEKQQLKTSNNSDDNDDEDEDVKPITFEDDADTVSRKQKVLNFCNSHGISYEYDTKKSLSCELKFKLPLKLITIDLPTVVRTAAEKTTLWEVEEINRAFIFKNDEKSKEETLKTDGINIAQMYMHRDILDVNRLYSNDVYRISQTYGIEAATNVIFQEVKNVFKLYGITVDSRHLSLIADYMTFDGTFRPLSRKGMDHSTSPLQQMTFESSLAFLKDATLKAKTDDLISPSSRLMLGQPCKTGTGAFGVYFKTQIST